MLVKLDGNLRLKLGMTTDARRTTPLEKNSDVYQQTSDPVKEAVPASELEIQYRKMDIRTKGKYEECTRLGYLERMMGMKGRNRGRESM